MNELARRFKALSEEHRLRILTLILRHGEVCVCEVESLLGMSQSAASRHLRYLASAGIVEGRREEQWVYYGLAEPSSKEDRQFLSMLRALLDDVTLPDVGPQLEKMRGERACSRESAGARTERIEVAR